METSLIKNFFKQTNLWASIVPMQIFGIWALYNIVTGQAPNWWWVATIIGYVAFVMLGVSAGYHRLVCHRSFEVTPVVRRILIWLGALAGQSTPIFWAAVHRGYHHRNADKDGDLHSPQDGFWHSYMGWMFTLDNKLSIKAVIDLMRDPDCAFVHRHYHTILWVVHGLVALISVDLWLYTMLLPAFIGLHSFSLNTSLNHYSVLGYANYKTNDNSTNSIWLFFLILGEAWHNNHHSDMRNPNYGKKWWELDPTYWIIKLLRVGN